ncbi:FimB/Mfa2 family fimbrial subunit [Bacteroides thetaiotaomicron]|uniref:FimB/Mfa2 family fimbrial subunit n=1 Tax=Bacteroides thetaiotaomicron TaxID=818 RepID=UPI002FD86540
MSLPVNDDGGSYDYTMYLTKNTNHICVILQNLSGEDEDVNQFTFRIEDENGLMAYDNELMADENITYRPWKMQNGEAGVGKEEKTVPDKTIDKSTFRSTFYDRLEQFVEYDSTFQPFP